jgi:LmbE family N-acetylglucosaminyl deacetylase
LAGSPILVVAAHPDDEILGCGGTMARLALEGHDVRIAILAEGMSSRYARREEADQRQLGHLHANAQQAADKVGAKELVLCKLPDNRLDTVPLLEVVKVVEDLIVRFRPAVIYTHHPGDLNVDHGVVHRAVLTATRPTAGQCVREIYSFEVPSSTEWTFQQLGPSFRPNVFVDIATTLETKIAALACYETEARPFPHPRSAEALRAIATRWGSVAGLQAAEAFELIRSVRPGPDRPELHRLGLDRPGLDRQ